MSTTTGNEQQSDCTGCQPGWVCKWGSSEPYICPAGSYCPVLAGYKILYKDYEYKCPKGTYNKLEGRVYEYECTECDEGYYCDEKGLTDVDDRECPTGHFCPKGTADPWECLPGTYQPNTGGSEEEDCTPCPKGSYCPQGSSEPAPCLDGYYCAPKAAMMQTCPGGYYCNEDTNWYPQSCPQNYYCPRGKTAPRGLLEHYCASIYCWPDRRHHDYPCHKP